MRAVEEVVQETPTVRTLAFTDAAMHAALPGQFAMVWAPGAGELPMSVMVHRGEGKAAFTVRRHGPASSGLFGTAVGGLIGVRGPYGNSFDVRRGRLLLVGGGTGMVPLMRLLSRAGGDDDVTVLIGARTAGEVFFEEAAGRPPGGSGSRAVEVSTEDGSRGRKGLVTAAAEEALGAGRFDAVYTCGPELMMLGVVRAAAARGVFVQASLERVMKCGVGMCGSCCAGADIVCRDGTVFDGDHLLANPDFGRSYRNKAGAPEAYGDARGAPAPGAGIGSR